MTPPETESDRSIVGSVLALCSQTPGAHRRSGPSGWRAELRRLKRAGFTRVDLLDNWLPFADLSSTEIDDLGGVLAELGLTAPCLGTSRRSLIDPDRAAQNLDYTLRIVEVAARLGVPRVGLGFHPALVDAQRGTSAFWEHAAEPDDRGPGNIALAAERVATVCDAARVNGIDVNIELYEDTLLCTAADVQRLVSDVDRPGFGVNPDLGNIIRSATPLREPWWETFRGSIPHMTYWHLKNYSRASPTPRGPFAIAPTALGDGTIDYRLAVSEALSGGYTGPFVVEHYGGDALWMQQRGAEYLRRLLDEVTDDLRDDPRSDEREEGR